MGSGGRHAEWEELLEAGADVAGSSRGYALCWGGKQHGGRVLLKAGADVTDTIRRGGGPGVDRRAVRVGASALCWGQKRAYELAAYCSTPAQIRIRIWRVHSTNAITRSAAGGGETILSKRDGAMSSIEVVKKIVDSGSDLR